MYKTWKEIIRFTAFLLNLLLTPRAFFRQYLAPEAEGSQPYWWVAVSLYFSNIFITPAIFTLSIVLKELIIIIVPLVGLLCYFMAGWLTQLMILICGGKASVEQSRSIAIYSFAVPSICSLLLCLTCCLYRYWFVVLIVPTLCDVIFFPYIGYVYYCGITTVPGTKKLRAIFFVILSMLFYAAQLAKVVNGLRTI